MRSLIFLYILIFSTKLMAAPRYYIVVGFSGYKTLKYGKGEPSGAHDNLPKNHAYILNHYKVVHYEKLAELDRIIEEFSCHNGHQYDDELGLIVMANSWGSDLSEMFMQRYYSKCGRLADFLVMIDGVSKPIGPFSKKVHAARCVNYYQRTGFVRGKRLNRCENIDLTDSCPKRGKACHIHVEWLGSSLGRDRIYNFIDSVNYY